MPERKLKLMQPILTIKQTTTCSSQPLKRNCDIYDYVAAGACGAIGGLIDIFLVGTPAGNASILEPWANNRIDSLVTKFAHAAGWKPNSNDVDDVAHAISFFEKNIQSTTTMPLAAMLVICSP